jgi:hypothetical protein
VFYHSSASPTRTRAAVHVGIVVACFRLELHTGDLAQGNGTPRSLSVAPRTFRRYLPKALYQPCEVSPSEIVKQYKSQGQWTLYWLGSSCLPIVLPVQQAKKAKLGHVSIFTNTPFHQNHRRSNARLASLVPPLIQLPQAHQPSA